MLLKIKLKIIYIASAIEVGIEPNIIVEFARIFGFEVDFQRDIEKEIGLKYIMKNLKMIIIKLEILEK